MKKRKKLLYSLLCFAIISGLTTPMLGVALADEPPQGLLQMDLQVIYDQASDSATVTWFPAFPDQIEAFDIVCYGDNGEIARVKTVSGEDRTSVIRHVARSGFHEVEVQAFDIGGTQIEVTPREPFFPGLMNEGLTPAVPSFGQPITLAAGQFDVSLVSADSRNFPLIYVTVRVQESGQPIDYLTKDNFSITEDGRVQTDMFDVTPPEVGGGVRMADVVFLIDNSGSMSGEIAAVKNNCEGFADALAASDIDYRLGLVQFGQSENGGHPRILGGLTADITEFKAWVGTMPASGGAEYGFEAIRLAIQTFAFRPGSQKVFVLITDEDSDDRDKQSTIDLILANDVTVHCAVNCGQGTSQSDYCGSGSVRDVSGGLLFPVMGNYTDILDTISGAVANTYIVRYRTDNPVKGVERRYGTLTVDDGVSSGLVDFSYVPAGAPEIQRTQATLDLHNQSLVEGSSPTISVTVTDVAQPFVQSATLHVRTTGSGSAYTEINMSPQGGNIYSAQVPGSNVQPPGLDYYIRATDGQVTSSDPSTDPDKRPYQIAVLPNQAPVIQHNPPGSWNVGSNVDLEIHATDSTYSMATLRVYYWAYGELLPLSSTVTYGSAPTSVTETFTLPVAGWSATAIEYYIEATDDLGVSSLWPAGGADAPYLLEADTIPPAIPTGLSATTGDAQVSLDWNDNTEPDLAGYNVYRSTTSGSGYTNIAATTVSNYLDTSLTNGTTYYYVVTALDTSSNESGYSNEVSATPQAAPNTTPPETKITAGPSGTIRYNDVRFLWTGSDDVTPTHELLYSYYLEEYDTDWSPWALLITKLYTDLPGGAYTFKVKAKDQAGNIDPMPAERSFSISPNQPPVADFAYSPTEPEAGQWVTFDASFPHSNDPDGEIVLFEWDWGNTGIINDRSANPEMTYYWDTSGTYQVRLIVTDNRGAIGTITKDIAIKEESFIEKIKGVWPWSKKLRTISEDEFKEIKRELNIFNYPYPYPEEDYFDRFSDIRANPDSDVDLYWYDDYDLRNALDKEIDREEAPGLTYGIYILNAINERKMVEYVWTQEYKRRASVFFDAMLEMNTHWSAVATPGLEKVLTTLLREPYASGASTIFLSYDIAQVGIGVSVLKKVLFYNSLYWYLEEERANGATHEEAWKSIQRTGCDPCAPQDYRVPSKGLFESEEEYKKKLNELAKYFEHLWDVFGEALRYNHMDEFRHELKNRLREILYSVLQRHKPELLDWEVIGAKSPIELRVYDSQGNLTGVVSGQAKEEIPYSVYGDEIRTVVIFSPSDSYRYEVVGTGQGTYGLERTVVEEGEAATVVLGGIPIALGVAHDYTIEIVASNPVGPKPTAWDVIGRFVDITTTATYTSPITVGISYDESEVTNEASLRMFHWNGTLWDDVTTSVDAANNIVNGQVSSLSPFFVGEPAAPEPTPPPGPGPGPSAGCFIATAAYGTPMAEELEVLRDFRDSYMLTNPVGSALVSAYYKLSPPVADFIDDHPTLKPIVRTALLPAVAMSTVAVNTTSAEKTAIVGSLALISIALAMWLSKRRSKGSRYC